MLKRHYDQLGADAAAVIMELKELSPEEAKKAQQIRDEMKALKEELAGLLGGAGKADSGEK